MITIYKYPLSITDIQTVKMPKGATILCAMDQNGTLCIWAEVNPANELEDRHIEVFGTGHPIDTNSRAYIASVVQGAYVWHVFQRITLRTP